MNWTKDNVEVSTSASYAITTVAAEETYVAHFNALPTYALTITASPAAGGTISRSPNYTEYLENEEVTLTATPNTGYTFVRWTKAGAEVSTSATYAITKEAIAEEYVAEFVPQIAVSYNVSDGSKGTTPNALTTVYYDYGTEFTVPYNWYISKEGYTMTAWTDGTNEYTPGTGTITLTENVELQPVFTENAQSLTRNTAAQTVKWGFNHKNGGAPLINCEGYTGYYVKRVNVNGTNLDVALYLNEVSGCVVSGTKGKVFNTNRENAQVRVNSLITIPAVKGMTVVIEADGTISTTTVGGNTYASKDGNKYTFNYNGENGTTDIVVLDANTYWGSISITFPKTATYVDVTSVGYRTFASSSALDFSEAIEGLTAYKATMSGKTVNFTPIDCAVPAATGMLIKAAEGRYYIPLAAGTPDAISNAFVGVTSSQTIDAGSFVLMNGAQGIGFYKTTSTFTAGANTAYLPADVVANAKTFIGFDEAMGIESPKTEKTANSQWFNLAGQRVVQPKKGLYIQNGKKVIVK